MNRCRTLFAVLVLVLGSAAAAQDAGTTTTPDGRFTIVKETSRTPVLSQDNTGTCWSFATISFLESEVERLTGEHADISELYPVYFTYLEKVRRFVDLKGAFEWGQGGLAHDLTMVLEKYGLAPQSAYDGLCGEEKRHDHGELERLLKGYAAALVGKDRKTRRLSPKWEAGARGILDAYLGEIPTRIEHEGRALTPQEYAKDVLKLDAAAYVEVMSDAVRSPLWSQAALNVPDNWWRYDRYLNVPIDDMMAAMDHALQNGFSVAIDVDVSEPGFRPQPGTASLPPELEKDGAVTQEIRDAMFTAEETTDDHLMHGVGIARDQEGRTWYLVKNSWGDRVGSYGGYVFMSRPYLAAKMLSFMVHKDGLPEEVRKKAKL